MLKRVYRLYVVALGEKKNLDEDLSVLIKLKLGREVEPDEPEIRRVLRGLGIRIEDLVASSGIRVLRKAMPELILALETLAERKPISPGG